MPAVLARHGSDAKLPPRDRTSGAAVAYTLVKETRAISLFMPPEDVERPVDQRK
jgi:hypothetical protein